MDELQELTEQQELIYKSATEMMTGLLSSGRVEWRSDFDRKNQVKYVAEKALTLYKQILVTVK